MSHPPVVEFSTFFRRTSRKDVFFVSYESFRADLVSRLFSRMPGEQLQTVLSVVDEMASSWDFAPHTTAIITSGGIPDAVRLFIASKSVENVSRGTLQNYLYTLKAFFGVVRHPVDEVTSADVRLWLAWYKQQHPVRNVTLEQKRLILNSFFAWCMDEDLIRRNPVRQVKPIRCEDPERLPLTPLELETVRKACRTLLEKAVVDFLYSTAARVSEFTSLDIADINFVDHTVRIRCGKGGKGRTTYLNAEAEVSLKSYLETRKDDCPALFVSSRRSRMSKRTAENAIRDIVSRCDLPMKVTPHIFRHTAASLALQRGMPIDQVQQFLGHSRIQTTLRYAKTLQADVKNAHSKFVA